jgi:hypothetical protein
MTSIMFLSAICFLAILLYIWSKWKYLKIIKEFRKIWGKLPEQQLNINYAKLLFKKNKNMIENSYCIDDNSWNNFNFDDVFNIFNRTLTPAGAQYLYYLLRHPTLSGKILKKRDRLSDSFSSNQNLREKVQIAISNLSDDNSKYLPELLWEQLPKKPSYAIALPIISITTLILTVLIVIQYIHPVLILPIFVVNYIIHFYVKIRVEHFVEAFQYIGVLISTANKIAKLPFPEISKINDRLKILLKDTKNISSMVFALKFQDPIGFFEYIKIYLLADLTGFYFALGKIGKYKLELRQIFETIGYLDTTISIASFRLEYPKYCKPTFVSDKGHYSVSDIYNPLIVNPIANSFTFEKKSLIVSGSNMAGKTTFLKTMGVNAILAQTINTCMATKYEAPLMTVLTSMEIRDNLIQGKSYYLSEIESILKLVNSSNSDDIHLLVLDEIFRGTNSVERYGASIEVLNYLANDKDFVIVATHDLEICKILDNKYSNFHFQEDMQPNGLSFDYKLHTGIATKRNAISLLKHVGYPSSIVEKANKRVQGY